MLDKISKDEYDQLNMDNMDQINIADARYKQTGSFFCACAFVALFGAFFLSSIYLAFIGLGFLLWACMMRITALCLSMVKPIIFIGSVLDRPNRIKDAE